MPLGSLVVFDDLHFLTNRLADGSLCTFYDEPGDPRRGHWIFEDPFSAGVRAALLEAAIAAGAPARDGGVLRARRRAALQHARGDPVAGAGRRHRRVADGGAGDRPVR